MKTHFLSMTTLAVLVLSSSVACASISKDTEKFVREATMGGKFEVESSQLALDRSTDPEVRAFAKMMVEDHTKAAEDLDKILVAADIDSSIKPAALDEKHSKILAKLREEDVKDFDEKYAEVQKKAHDDTVDLFKDYAEDGDNAELKTFASNTLPTLRDHEKKAKVLESQKD